MEAEMVSREDIKPSSPTPPHLRTHKISLLDQTMAPVYLPLLVYFPPPDNRNVTEFTSQTTLILKQSLSETLTRFYPLAGRVLEDRLSIDCNDEGALFVVYRIHGNLSEFLKNPDVTGCWRHVADGRCWSVPDSGGHVAMFQVSYFECGGVAIGSIFLHTVIDGATIATFMKAWSAAASSAGDEQSTTTADFPDYYTARSLFPQNEAMQMEQRLTTLVEQKFKIGTACVRRYVFDSSTLSTFRAKLQPEMAAGTRRLSRVEIVSAFLWKCFLLALAKSEKSDAQIASVVTQGVNLRRRSDPILPDHAFGNFLWTVPASVTVDQSQTDDDVDLKQLISELRTALGRINGGFMAEMQGEEGFLGYCRNFDDTKSRFPENAEHLNITSWCNFGVYEIDFGWGKPVWASRCDTPRDTDGLFVNMVWLTDTRHGGIEAWLTIDQRYTAAFDDNQELRNLASLDPSPLDFF